MSLKLGVAILVCAVAALQGAALAQRVDKSLNTGPIQRFNPAQDVGLDQKLGAQVPLELPFRDEAGREVKLGDYFGAQPVLLSLVYYECPMLCTEVLNEELRILRTFSLEPGRDFQLVTVSIDPHETPELAAQKKQKYLDQVDKPALANAWHFLVGGDDSIQKLAATVGFRYVFDPNVKQFAHAGGVIVLTPKGVVSRYFYGIEYIPRDVRLALVEAADGKIGTLVDQVLMLCFHYDPVSGKYGFAVINIVRLAGILTVLTILGYIWRNARREARKNAALRAAAIGESR